MLDTQIQNNTEVKAIVDTILDTVPAIEIYLFGSYANGTANDDSDFDFYVVVPDEVQPIESTWKIKSMIRKSTEKKRSVDMYVGTESKFNKYKDTISFIEAEVMRPGVKLHG
jgi:predicted nucleotidyltransferase